MFSKKWWMGKLRAFFPKVFWRHYYENSIVIAERHLIWAIEFLASGNLEEATQHSLRARNSLFCEPVLFRLSSVVWLVARGEVVPTIEVPYPELLRKSVSDPHLEYSMATTRRIVELGRALREKHKIKIRQPLQEITIISSDLFVRQAAHNNRELIAEELNVKNVIAVEYDNSLATLSFKANFKTLGKKMGSKMKGAAEDISKLTSIQWFALERGEPVKVQDVEITKEDVIVARTACDGITIASGNEITVALNTVMTDALKCEGLAMEIKSCIQNARKDKGFAPSDRINVVLAGQSEVIEAVLVHFEHIQEHCLIIKFEFGIRPSMEKLQINEYEAKIYLEVAPVGVEATTGASLN